MNTLQERISVAVKSKRKELGMSQEELAERIDKSSSYVGQLERGESSLKIETLQKLIHCLGLDANALLADDELPADMVCEVCNLVHGMSEDNLHILAAFARFLQNEDAKRRSR